MATRTAMAMGGQRLAIASMAIGYLVRKNSAMESMTTATADTMKAILQDDAKRDSGPTSM